MESNPNFIRRRRRTGFTPPLDWRQVISWVGYLAHLVLYFAVLFPTFTPFERVALTVPFVVLYLSYNLCFIAGALERHKSPYVDSAPASMCGYCRLFVRRSCKHCGMCDVCRRGFDHHCFWLNNCVTKANYRHFLVGICLLTASALFTTLLSVWVVMANEYDGGRPLSRACAFYRLQISKYTIYALAFCLLVGMLGIEVFMAYVLALHCLLNARGLSTWELIKYRKALRCQIAVKKNN
jgi:hypothetical protein